MAAAAALDTVVDTDERNLMVRIAEDEACHAELAWKMMAWTLRGGGEVASELEVAAVAAAHVAAQDEVSRAVWREVISLTLDALLVTA